MPPSLHHVKGTYCLHHLSLAADFDCLAEEVLARLCQVTPLIFSFHVVRFRRQSWRAIYTERVWNSVLPPWGESIYITTRHFLHGRFVSSPPLYLVNHLLTSVWTYKKTTFCTLGYTMILLYFTVEISPALAMGALSVGSCVPVTPPYCGWFGLSTSLFSVPREAPDSPCTIPALVVDPAISPRSPGSFYWRMVLEIQTWAFILVPDGMSLLLGPCSSQSKGLFGSSLHTSAWIISEAPRWFFPALCLRWKGPQFLSLR